MVSPELRSTLDTPWTQRHTFNTHSHTLNTHNHTLDTHRHTLDTHSHALDSSSGFVQGRNNHSTAAGDSTAPAKPGTTPPGMATTATDADGWWQEPGSTEEQRRNRQAAESVARPAEFDDDTEAWGPQETSTARNGGGYGGGVPVYQTNSTLRWFEEGPEGEYPPAYEDTVRWLGSDLILLEFEFKCFKFNA